MEAQIKSLQFKMHVSFKVLHYFIYFIMFISKQG